jgi:hypothetical protein
LGKGASGRQATPNQVPTALRAEILLRGLQKVAIISLVDEATGYQYQRPKDELRKILEAYISKELLPWTERFPEEFYQEMFRLRNWKFSSLDYTQKGPQGPRYPGKLTKELVYKHLPPGILTELERLNPVVKGRRKKKSSSIPERRNWKPAFGKACGGGDCTDENFTGLANIHEAFQQEFSAAHSRADGFICVAGAAGRQRDRQTDAALSANDDTWIL